MSRAWIALGSNLGDRAASLARAVDMLADSGVRPLRISNLYETTPEAGGDEPDYLNGVLEAETWIGAAALLSRMHRVEEHLGRDPAGRSGPRAVDLDLLSFDDLVTAEAGGPILPHPRLHNRGFVLVPLCELDVHWRHPALGLSAGELLAGLPPRPGAVRLHGPLGGGAAGPEAPTQAFTSDCRKV